jgi:hypothetical protein
VTRSLASVLIILLSAGGSARASAAAPEGPSGSGPGPPPSREQPEPQSPKLVGFAAELGGSPGVFVAKVGFGARQGESEAGNRWMGWLEADGTDWFRPSHPADAGRVDQMLWIYPHLELTRQLVRRPLLSGFVRAGPTIGRYSAGGGVDHLWFPGVAAGAGLLWSPIRLGVTLYGQWKSGTVPLATATASPDVRMTPMVLVTAGLELVKPLGP